MKRWLLRICVLLVLGAIINVAVAAAISVYTSRGSWHQVTYKTLDVPAVEAVVLQRAQGSDRSIRAYKQYEARGFGWKSTMGNSSDQPITGDGGHFGYLRVFGAGWPSLALQGEYRSGDSLVLPQGFHNAWGRYRLAASGRGRGADSDMFPLKPLWPGFANQHGVLRIHTLAALRRAVRVAAAAAH